MEERDTSRADDKAMHAQLVDDNERTAAGLDVLAKALGTYGAVVDTAEPHLNPNGVVDVYADRIDAEEVQRLLVALGDVTVENWTGESGSRYRTYSGVLFGRTLHIIQPVDSKTGGWQ